MELNRGKGQEERVISRDREREGAEISIERESWLPRHVLVQDL